MRTLEKNVFNLNLDIGQLRVTCYYIFHDDSFYSELVLNLAIILYLKTNLFDKLLVCFVLFLLFFLWQACLLLYSKVTMTSWISIIEGKFWIKKASAGVNFCKIRRLVNLIDLLLFWGFRAFKMARFSASPFKHCGRKLKVNFSWQHKI